MQEDCWKSVPHTVLLFNFGGPEKSTDVEPFLRRLFEDPFIIRARIPDSLRKMLAKRISGKRKDKATEEYAKIGFSPINGYTRDQAAHLEYQLGKRRPGTKVVIVNRYTAPYAADVVKSLPEKGGRFFMISLYPHVCHSTTVSSYRDFDLALTERFGERNFTTSRVFSWWHNPAFLDYSASQVFKPLNELVAAGKKNITVLFSAHGIPKRYQQRGDPYVNEIYAHYEEIRQRCNIWLQQRSGHNVSIDWNLSFQSRVGPVEWTKPYTDESIVSLARNKGALVMVPISFVSDHIETLFEMDHTYRELALSSGFEGFQRVIPANSDPILAECLADVLVHHGF
jgi:ferrochelatase